MKIFIPIFFSILLISCSTDSREEYSLDFEKRASLSISDSKRAFENSFLNRLMMVDTFYVGINRYYSGVPVFRIFDSKGTLLVESGSYGRGPKEFEPSVLFTGETQTMGQERCFWVTEMNKGLLRRINLDKTLKENKIVVDKVEEFPKSAFFGEYLLHQNDSTLIGNVSNLDPNMSPIREFNLRTKKVTSLDNIIPKLPNPYKLNTSKTLSGYNYLLTSCLRRNNSNGNIAMSLYGRDNLLIFNKNKESKSFIGLPMSKYDDSDVRELISKSIMYYLDLSTNHKLIYALYLGHEFGHEGGKSEIRVFDWNGTAKSCISLPKEYSMLVVDKSTNTVVLYDGKEEAWDKYTLPI